MQKDHLSQLREHAEQFGVFHSIDAGLLNYKTLAHAIVQAVTLPAAQFHEKILDKLYGGISRDDFAFVESLYKINKYANGEPNLQRKAFIQSLESTCRRIDELIAVDENIDQFVLLPPYPNHDWFNRMPKPRKAELSEEQIAAAAQRVRGQADDQQANAEQRPRPRALLGMLILGELLSAEHDENCPFHHGPHDHEDDDHDHDDGPNCFVQ